MTNSIVRPLVGREPITPPPKIISELVERFSRHRDAYLSGQYNETQVRREFIDPFFSALGWDVDNEGGYAEAYKDVIHEDSIKVSGITKAPDYCFRIGGIRKFFLEAKRPASRLAEEPAPAFQLRRYGWSAKLPLSILTDFEEFVVYDCRRRPSHEDKASTARVLYMSYQEYTTKWGMIADVFSKDAVLKGSFDRFAQSVAVKKGTAEVDEEFLQDIEAWREVLARNLALRNPRLTQRELNFSVQRTIDRLIFLRICEDRGIERYGQLRDIAKSPGVYSELSTLFQRADDRYNSGLFHFHAERDRTEEPDDLTLNVEIEDKPLFDIISSLYYPQSPYEFSVLSADILGQVYEQFLGKVIRLTPSHRAVVEEKPEVKKAGGVYYTPAYVVEFILHHTLDTLLQGRTPKQVATLRVLDPACGSGSFLIAAYQALLEWHRNYYLKNGPENHTREIYQGARGLWRLVTAERKRILLNCIYGVDVDPQAVEVTKLSLLLKVLEGESEETLASQRKLFHQRALPDLGSNIKCGNSLIGSDFYRGRQIRLLESESVPHLNPFDWHKEYEHIFGSRNPGFDVVIGNPPYVLLQSLNDPEVFDYIRSTYRSARYKIDTYQVFIEKAIQLAKDGGRLGFITPNSFLRNKHAVELRRLLLESTNIEILRLFFYRVFRGASVDTVVVVLERQRHPAAAHPVTVIQSVSPKLDREPCLVRRTTWAGHPQLEFGVSVTPESEALVRKIQEVKTRLGDFATAYFGIQTFNRDRFVSLDQLKPHFRPVVDGTNISRYHLAPPREYVDYRPAAIKSGGKQGVYEIERVGVRQIGEVPIATLLPAGVYTLNTIYNVYNTKDVAPDPRFTLALLSSRAVGWYWRKSFFDQKMTFPKIKKGPLLSLPIPGSIWSARPDRKAHDQLVSYVDRMLTFQRELREVRTEHQRLAFRRKIDALDEAIDVCVYELYRLSDAEIRIIEDDPIHRSGEMVRDERG